MLQIGAKMANIDVVDIDLSHTIFKLKYLEITLKCIAVPAIQLIEPMNMLNCKLDYLPGCNNSFVYTENVILMKAM